ncbi:hypothetical protein [Marinobacter sp. CHS3-4]|uniref:hypothetical protein n=1 Tax=Marinobacter sp. CHS3-4 TaxID=3045174 RepID=UPI0024B4B27D|nr:hypothetical protein [Marinobacter sp. CHS3-4]MDI9244200.1 hypothetical protein [Marinobacter sp. CHS3-4]
MRFFIFLMFFPMLAYSEAGDKNSFLAAWENHQRDSESVKEFRKLSNNKYHINFENLPYEGDLILLTYDVDEIPYGPKGSRFTKTGYVEVDIPDAMDELMQKYSRTYYKWAQNNTLYFDSNSKTWVDAQEYASSLGEDSTSIGDKLFVTIYEYWSYALIAIILYFLWSTIINNKRSKEAIEKQEKALEESLKLSEESIRQQKQSVAESIELHKETNRVLSKILEHVEKKSM